MAMSRGLEIPESLPIAEYKEALLGAFKAHQVTIVCGDTGSGKTTQLPKLAHLARPEARGLIGITQPRRLATVAMARRLAEETGSALGTLVGFQHRFERKLSRETRFKFMTDGVLLAESREDPQFRRYSTLIIDEAHERSLNIDFLLGLLKRLLPRRPDLRVVVSSATLDAERFASFFGGAPVVSIPGRLYPIEAVWMDETDEDALETDTLPQRVGKALARAGSDSGDVLVFLPGEREIRETMLHLERQHLPRTEVLPLLASLPPGEQARVFKHSELRRIILATNVAETSLTIPGIRVVIDSGLARIKRYSQQRHVQTLRIEPISQASARQRMGRCGRVGPGRCIRLYSEEDYAKREAFTAPEIKRSALAGVILAMADLRLGAIEQFPFLEPPTGVAIREGMRELLELGAIARATASAQSPEAETRLRLTSIGRALAAFPVEPRFARILLAAEHEQNLRDALTVVAALSCEEPLLRPLEKAEQADQQHARFRCTNSDFLGRLKVWAWWQDEKLGTSETQRRKRCKAAFVSYPRMREWANVRSQLEELCRERGLHTDEARGGEGGLHRALLCGLLSHLGHYDPERRDYRGAFAIRFALFPGSGLFRRAGAKEKKVPAKQMPRPANKDAVPESREWVVAGELVETARLFGRRVACIDPRWIEPIAAQLCKVHRHSAFWDKAHGFVRVHEDVTLFGLPIASGRIRDLSRLDPVAARRFFIADALATPGGMLQPPAWLRENWSRQRLLEQVFALRRRDPEDLHEALLAFYEANLPAEICNAPALKKCPPLPLTGEHFAVDAETLRAFPERIDVGGETFELTYRHQPGAEDDGVTLEALPETLGALRHWHAEWLVPGLLPEKVLWLLNAQPSRVRHLLGSLPELRDAFIKSVQPYTRGLYDALFRFIKAEKGVQVEETAWQEDKLPAHLRLNFRVVSPEGRVLGEGRNLAPLIALFAPQSATPKANTLADRALAHLLNRRECLDTLCEWGGARWQASTQMTALPMACKAFAREAGIDLERLGKETLLRAVEEVFLREPADPKTEAELRARYAAKKAGFGAHATALRRHVSFILSEAARLEGLAQTLSGIYPDTQEDALEQLAWLVFDGFVATVPTAWLDVYPRFLQGIDVRLARAKGNPAADRRKMASLLPRWQRYTEFASRAQRPRHDALALASYRWAVECCRLALFAPEVPPPERFSERQLDALWEKVLSPT